MKIIFFILFFLVLINLSFAQKAVMSGESQKQLTSETFWQIIDKIKVNPELVDLKLKKATLKKIENYEKLIIKTKWKNIISLSRGKFEKIYLLAKGVEKKNFRIDEVKFLLKDIQLDMMRLWNKEKIRLISIGKLKFKIKILEKDINNFFKNDRKKRKVKNPRIRITDKGIYFTGKAKWWIFNSSFKVRGKFEIRNQDEIYFIVNKARFSLLPLPASLIKSAMKKLNPLCKLDNLPFPVKIDKIYTKDGVLYIESK